MIVAVQDGKIVGAVKTVLYAGHDYAYPNGFQHLGKGFDIVDWDGLPLHVEEAIIEQHEPDELS